MTARLAHVVLVALVLALGVSGCATRGFTLGPGDEALRGHYILAHEDGWPAATDREPLKREAYQSQIAAILDGIDEHALAAQKRGEPARLLIFAHGGLNGYADDFARMRSLMIGSGGDGLLPKTSYYPIFINWNSALGDSLMDDLFFVRFGRRRPWLALPTAPFALAARLAESVFNAPSSLWANTWNFDELDPGVTDWAEAIGKWPVTVVMTPILKAFGTSAWQIMKRRADLLVASRLDGNPAGAEEGAGYTLVEALCDRTACDGKTAGQWQTKSGERVDLEITLVGHSMGALVVNRLLREELPVKRVVYMAPAASIDAVEGSFAPRVRGRRGTEFWVFALSRKDEARERDPSGLLPRGSLLVWIDHFFEPIATLGDNRSGRHKAHVDYYGSARPPKDLRYYPMPGKDGDEAKKHGSFDDPPVFARVLCTVDARPFSDPTFCRGRAFVLDTPRQQLAAEP